MINIKSDSRKVKKGDIFVALNGISSNGEDYVDVAIKNGASKIIVESDNKYSVETIKVKDTRAYLNEYLNTHYKSIIDEMNIIGLTGTNGKTTTCYLIYQALNSLNIKCAYIGTIGYYLDKKVCSLSNTSPDACDLFDLIVNAYDNGYKTIVMEASSQGLAMNRLEGIRFNYAIFTNLTQDHLDYHKTMDNYIEAKKMLFEKLDGTSIINVDDEYSSNFMINDNIVTYGRTSDQYKIDNIAITKDGTTFTVNDIKYSTKLLGEYNVYNITIVIILLELMNLDTKVIELLEPPKGRIQIINYNDNSIIIDYAHTPDAVLKVLNSMRDLNPKNIITIIGCGGNRDKLKRPIMGKIAVENSDYVIFTTDNPRYENKRKILKDITCKLDKSNYRIIVNRYKAIKKGIQKLSKNDILLVLGKGHEEYQDIKGKKTHFSDYDTVINIIRR